jgi:hypothetical protein
MKKNAEIAHEICNTVGCADNYPQVYQAAYELEYRGRVTNKTRKALKGLQSEDVRKWGYVPAELLNNLQRII